MNKKLTATVLAASILLTGCTSVPDLSQLNQDIEAEYIAGVLLKYDKNYDHALKYDRSLLKPTPAPTRTPAPTAMKLATGGAIEVHNTTGTAVGQKPDRESVSLSQMYSIKGVEVIQGSYAIKNSYGSSFAPVTAGRGKKLIVIHFRIKNTTSRKKRVDLSADNLSYQLEIDGKTMKSPLLSIVKGDLQYFNQKVGAGNSKPAVLLFEVNKLQKIKNANMIVSDERHSATVAID